MGGTRECTIGEAQPAEVRCARVDSNFLRVLGVTVAEGRDFTPEDDVRGAPLVAVISHALWRSRYGADPAAVGRTLSLDSTNAPVQRVPIVGVLPADFEMPIGTADILLPMQMRPLDMKQPVHVAPDGIRRASRRDVTAERAELMLAPQLPEVLQFMPPAGRADVVGACHVARAATARPPGRRRRARRLAAHRRRRRLPADRLRERRQPDAGARGRTPAGVRDPRRRRRRQGAPRGPRARREHAARARRGRDRASAGVRAPENVRRDGAGGGAGHRGGVDRLSVCSSWRSC